MSWRNFPHYITARVMNKCCQGPWLTAAIPCWKSGASRKSPHLYWPWLSINKTWSIAHEAWLWQPSPHWAEFTEINIPLSNTYLPCATIYNLCHSCSTFWHSLSHTEGSSFSHSQPHCSAWQDTLETRSALGPISQQRGDFEYKQWCMKSRIKLPRWRVPAHV